MTTFPSLSNTPRKIASVSSLTVRNACWAWAKLADDLRELCPEAHPEALLARLQRPWTWSDGLPKISGKLRTALEKSGGLELPKIVETRASSDGSRKMVIELPAGDRVEAVHMPRDVLSGRGRVTLCVSSQVGCAMGCTFCATAQMGFQRNLSAGEIVAQVLVALHALGPRHPGELSLVFMGMGEPLHNFEHVVRAVRVLCAENGLGLSPRRITVSTSGLVPEITALGAVTPRPLLAVSLNATTDEQRRELMPVARRWSLAELKSTLASYPVRSRERITLEYVLLAGINDSNEDARRLANFGASFPHHLNLIPFNEHPSSSFRAPSEARVDEFAQALLAERPAIVTVRRSRGRDIAGACGQLVQS